MKRESLPYKTIVFVCTNSRNEANRISCADKGREGEGIREELKQEVKKRGWKGIVRVCSSGCMDKCEEGPNVMVFSPDRPPQWFNHVSVKDVPQILSEIPNVKPT